MAIDTSSFYNAHVLAYWSWRFEAMICESCGQEMAMGYGLAGGGVGPYFYCENESCADPKFHKFQDPEMEDDRERTKDSR